MSSSKEDIQKYIFDPEKPRQCHTYKLLLNIAKENNLVFVSPDFTIPFYEESIVNQSFINKIWDMPNNFEKLNIKDKIDLYIKSLSKKEYYEHIDSLNITSDKFIYNKIFDSFFDVHPSDYLKKMNKYNNYLIKSKILKSISYSFEGYSSYRDNYSFNQKYQGNKILFTNDNSILEKSDLFFDVSSVVITTEKELFLDSNLLELFGEVNWKDNINKNLKPIFLKKIDDVKILLKVLEEDLKKEKQKDIKKEEITNLKSVEINNFFSIKNLKIGNIEDKKEIYIVGENGDGKSLFLQALAVAMKGCEKDGQETFRRIKNDYSLNLEDMNKNIYNGVDLEYKNLYAYGANRNNNCQMLEDESGFLTLFDTKLDLKNPITWLKVIDHRESRKEKNILTVNQAKNLLKSLLNSDVEIEISPDAVVFKEKGSIVSFEQLSAGYKGVITIIADLLVRLSENQPYVTNINEFKGIVLIDEVELHLHPKWKYDFVKKIRNIFPNIQFIMTTHSPTVLLGASKEAVFYKIYKEDGEVHISKQIENEGYTNNSLVSSPLFDLETITSRDYNKRISSDDYVYDKIHERVSLKIKEDVNIDEDKILKLIDEELDNL